MIIDVKSKTKAEFSQNFRDNVTPVKSYYSRERLKQRGKFVGYIEGDRFWLVTTKKSFLLAPCRRFCGRIIEDREESFVQGEFKADKAYLLSYFLLVLAFYIFCEINIGERVADPVLAVFFAVGMLLSASILTAILYWVRIIYANEGLSKEVVEFISRL